MIDTIDTPSTKPIHKHGRKTSAAQAGAIGRGLINLALMIFTIRDIRRRSDEELNGKRKLWLMAAFTPPIGPIAYFIFGRKRGAQPSEIPLPAGDNAA